MSRSDIAEARQIDRILRMSSWMNLSRGRIATARTDAIEIKYPSVLKYVEMVADWYMAMPITGGKEPLSISPGYHGAASYPGTIRVGGFWQTYFNITTRVGASSPILSTKRRSLVRDLTFSASTTAGDSCASSHRPEVPSCCIGGFSINLSPNNSRSEERTLGTCVVLHCWAGRRHISTRPNLNTRSGEMA